MDQQFDTTFIPKSPLLQDERGTKRREPISLTTFIALVVLFVSMIVAGGVYFLKHTLEGDVAKLETELKSKEASYDVSQIEKLMRTGKRLSLAKGLVEKHIAVSSMLEMLGLHTITTGSYHSFNYEIKEGAYLITAEGMAPTFAALAYQADVLRRQSLIEEVSIMSPHLDTETGLVMYTLHLKVSPKVFSYVQQQNHAMESLIQPVAVPDATPSADPVISTVAPSE